MKTVVCAIVLMLGFVGHSQNPISFGNNQIPKNKFQYSTGITISPLSFNFNYINKKSFATGYALEVYNPLTQLNDNYIRVNDSYFMTNIQAFPKYGFDGIKMDSLNPYGTSDVGGAVISGLINLLINPDKSGF